jgi:hypothetical protein
METKIRKDIFDKLVAFDNENGTGFAMTLSHKVNGAEKGAYFRGIVHGMCLALTELGVITRADALDILDLVIEFT